MLRFGELTREVPAIRHTEKHGKTLKVVLDEMERKRVAVDRLGVRLLWLLLDHACLWTGHGRTLEQALTALQRVFSLVDTVLRIMSKGRDMRSDETPDRASSDGALRTSSTIWMPFSTDSTT